MTTEELVKRLNEVCLEEFRNNYNKSEYARVFYTNEKAKELQEELSKNIQEGYKVQVSDCGTLFIYKVEGEGMYRTHKTVLAPVAYKLPYAYSMGRPVSKKAMLETVDYIVKEYL